MRIKWFSAIRAFGLFLVLGYHLFYSNFTGGFFGVDIFFTLSGFLITAVIIEEVRKKKGFNILSFYKRRFIRIFPPLFFSVIFTLPFVLFISPDFTVDIAKKVAAALGFVTNWYQIITGGSYEAQMLPSLYVHTWFLAVEMQFYIIWGVVCAFFAVLSNLFFKDNRRYIFFKFSLLIVSAGAAVLSFLFMQNLFNAGTDLSEIYFHTFSRLLPFFIGSAAAAIWGVHHESHKIPKMRNYHIKNKILTALFIFFAVLAVAAVSLFAVTFTFSDVFVYRYGFLFTSLLTVALIYGAHALHNLTPLDIDEPKLLKIIADLSYNIYLFHWPLYIICSALIMNHTAASGVTLVVSVIISAVMFYGAERIFIPANGKGALKHRRAAVIIVSVFAAVSLAANAEVIRRAPDITSIETDFAVSYVMQDVENIMSLKRKVDAVNDMPVIYKALQANLLPEEPAAEPETTLESITTIPPELETTTMVEPAPTESQPTTSVTVPDAVALNITGGVTVIGDSVALGAQATLMKNIPDCYVDAGVSRQIKAGYDVLIDLQEKEELREYVVIALGTNGHHNFADLMTQIIDGLNSGHRLIFVTPFDGRANENANILNETAEWLRDLPNQYDYITIADWHALISTQANLLAGDRVHLGGPTSMSLYSDCIAEALIIASQKPMK